MIYKIRQFFTQQNLILLLIFFIASACGSARKAKSQKNQARRVIQTARTFMGTPYRWGGTTKVGMDCSGLLVNSFRSIDVALPRTSAQQALVGKKVSLEKLRSGDLVFFATGKSRRKITHVGIVTSIKNRENVKFIHASSSLGVVETNLYTTYYLKRFRFARRVIY